MPHQPLPPSQDMDAATGTMPTNTAPPLSRRQRAARVARRTARYGAWSLLGLVLLALALVLGVWQWSAHNQSLDTVIRMVRNYLPASMTLEAQDVTGTLRQGGHIGRLVYTAQATEAGGYASGQLVVTLDDITVAWNLASLTDRATRLSAFHVKTATLQDTRMALPRSTPKEPLQSLTLPVSVELPFAIDTLRIVNRTQSAPIVQDSPAEAAAAASAAQRAGQQRQADKQRQRLNPKPAAASAATAGELAASAAAVVASAATTGRLELPPANASTHTPDADAPAANDTVITHIQGRYDYDRITARHTLALDTLTVANGTWQGHALIEGRAPMRSQIQAQGVIDIPASLQMPAQRLQANAAIEGTLGGQDALLDVNAHVTPMALLPAANAASGAGNRRLHTASAALPAPSASGRAAPVPPASAAALASAGTRLDLQASVHPWHTQPLVKAHATWQQLDAQAFWPSAPRTLLQGSLALDPVVGHGATPASAMASAASSPQPAAPAASAANPQAPGMLGFLGDRHWQLDLHVHNADSGAWDRGQLPLQQLQMQAQYHAGALTVSTLDARVGGGSVQGQGRYDPQQGWQGDMAVRSLNPGLVDSRFAAAPISGTLAAHAPVQTGANPAQAPVDFSIKLASDGGSSGRAAQAAKGLAFDLIDVQGRWQAQSVHLPRLVVRTRDATLQGTASYALATQEAKADLALVLPGSQATVKGDISATSGQGRAQARVADLQKTAQWLQQWPGTDRLRQQVLTGNATLDLDWRGGWQHNGNGLHLNARLDAPALTLAKAGAPPETATRMARTLLTVQGTLAQAALNGSTHVQQGAREIDLALSGTAGKQAQGWHAQLQATQLQLKDQLQNKTWLATLANPVAIQISQSNGVLQVQTAALRIDLSGAAPGSAQILAEPIRFVQQGNGYTLMSKGRLTHIPLAWLDALSSSALSSNGLSGDLDLAGDWDVQLGNTMRIRAVLQRSQGDLIVIAEGGGATGNGGHSGRIQAGIRQAQLEITGSGNQVQTRLIWDSANAGTAQATLNSQLARNADGGWTLPANAPLRGSLHANLPRVGLWSMFAPPGWRLRGTLQADASINGTLSAPQVHGTLQADNLGVRSVVDGIEFSHGTLRTRLNGQRLDIDTLTLQGPSVNRAPGGSAQITGHVQWGASGASLMQSVQMHLSARLQALQLSSMPERQIVLSGNVDAQLVNQRLTVRGGLKVDRALIDIPTDIAPKFDADVVILPSKQHPKAVLAQPAQGNKPSSTDTALAAAPDSDIAIKPGNRTRADKDAVPSTASHTRNTRPAGTSASPGAAPKPAASPQARALAADPATAAATRRTNASIVPDIHVTVDMGDDLRVRGQGLDTRLRGTLVIENGSTLQAMPKLTGTIRTDRGTFRAYGQELDIESGRIAFNGVPDNPLLDITAIRPNLGTDTRVGVRIRGTAQRPQVQLFSNPEMPDAEKLSWLVLGRSSAGAADAALLQQAALALLAGNGRGITGDLADALGLDTLSFRGGEGGSVSSGSVTLGKRFSKNFYVAYERGLDATLGTLYFFYDISRRLKLRGQTGSESAIDLIYTISYD